MLKRTVIGLAGGARATTRKETERNGPSVTGPYATGSNSTTTSVKFGKVTEMNHVAYNIHGLNLT